MAYEEAFFRRLPTIVMLIEGSLFFLLLTKTLIRLWGNVLLSAIASTLIMGLLYLSLV
jgi:hypothetical protein